MRENLKTTKCMEWGNYFMMMEYILWDSLIKGKKMDRVKNLIKLMKQCYMENGKTV